MGTSERGRERKGGVIRAACSQPKPSPPLLSRSPLPCDRGMGDHRAPNSLGNPSCSVLPQHPDQRSSLLLGHQILGASASGSTLSKMPFPSFNLYSGGASIEPIIDNDPQAGASLCTVRGSAREQLPEQDFEQQDCESEEGVGASEGPAQPNHRRGSGSKRSRAAEVHNMSEKRRRSRINEKMKALQSLIPNSNKTDKASMLDEAIEYLKQLQLQVQMLSMRNGLYLHPTLLSGALQPLQASQACMEVGVPNEAATKMGVGLLAFNQDSAPQHSLDQLDRCLTNIPIPESSFHVESLHPHLRTFQLPTAEFFREDIMLKQQLASGQSAMPGQASHAGTDSADRSQDTLPKDQESQIFSQQFHSLLSGNTESGAKDEQKEL